MAMASSLPPGFERALGSLQTAHHHIPVQTTNVVAKKVARESKKVSWAPEDSLCQVRLFAAEEPPAQSSITLQEMLLPKKARFMHMINPVAHADLPPGFGPSTQMGLKPAVAAIVPQLPWRIPEHYELDPNWLVMAGGDSKEVSVQKQRENRTLEAVYPRPSAIPESPAEPSEPHFHYDKDDVNTLIIPVVPLEDDDSPDPDDVPTTSGSTYNMLEEYSFPRVKSLSPPPGFNSTIFPAKSRNWLPEAPQESITMLPASLSTANVLGPPVSISGNILPPNGMTTTTNARTAGLPARTTTPPPTTTTTTTTTTSEGAGPDVAAAAAAAYAALSQSNDHTMIDRELLIKFLTNPSMLQNLSEKLAGSLEPPATNGARQQRAWNPTEQNTKGGTQRYVESLPGDPHSGHGYDRPPGFGAPATGGNGSYVAPALPQQSISPPASVSGSGRQRDDQYYKDLISQHGRKNEETLWGAGDTESGFGGRPRTNGIDRDRKLEKADRMDRSERLDRWADRDVDSMEMGARAGEESRSGQSRGKSRKACIYFTTSRGCRNGSSCAFVHESNNAERVAKRPKLEGKESSKGYRYTS